MFPSSYLSLRWWSPSLVCPDYTLELVKHEDEISQAAHYARQLYLRDYRAPNKAVHKLCVLQKQVDSEGGAQNCDGNS